MGRSFALPSTLLKEGKLRLPPGGATLTHAKSGCRYRVFVEGGVLKHSEIRLDDTGSEAFTDTRAIAFVLGSGDRGQTFLQHARQQASQGRLRRRKPRCGIGLLGGGHLDTMERSGGSCGLRIVCDTTSGACGPGLDTATPA